jgi:hypothetical protein
MNYKRVVWSWYASHSVCAATPTELPCSGYRPGMSIFSDITVIWHLLLCACRRGTSHWSLYIKLSIALSLIGWGEWNANVIRHPAMEPDTRAFKEISRSYPLWQRRGLSGIRTRFAPAAVKPFCLELLGIKRTDSSFNQDYYIIGGYCNFSLYLLSEYNYHVYYYSWMQYWCKCLYSNTIRYPYMKHAKPLS